MNARFRILALACIAFAIPLTGCDKLVLENLAVGLRDGAVTAASGIVEGFFNSQFNLGEDAAPEEANDEHVHI
jgi:hypothetical protein